MRTLVLLVFFQLVLMAQHEFRSCYDYYKLDIRPEMQIDEAVFVLLDQTTLFDRRLKDQIVSMARSRLRPGNHVYLAKFSAFVNGYYNDWLFDATLDRPLSESQRYEIRKSTLSRLDNCLKKQKKYIRKKIKKSLENAFLKEEEHIPKSDILFALKDFSENVIKKLSAKRKIVIIASDMLENSSVTSFYHNGHLRTIDPEHELKKVEKAGLFGDFDGAEVYVIGAGIINDHHRNRIGYKDTRSLMRLKKFWQKYFEYSKARLIEMGAPALKHSLH